MTQTKVLDDDTMVNAGVLALKKAQAALAGVAERAGIHSEEDVVKLCKEVRRELYKERPELYEGYYARHD